MKPIQGYQIETNKDGIKQKYAVEKISLSSSTYINGDPNFPHTLTSIGTQIRNDLPIQWHPIEIMCSSPNYSDDIEDLQTPCFCNKSITHSLLILNWFAIDYFTEIFQERKIKPNCLFQYSLKVNGIFYRTYIDSYIPFKGNKPIFAQNISNSIFPSLFQKLLAKVYGSYQSIPDNVVDIVELITGYAKQGFKFSRFSIEELIQVINKAVINGDLFFFRTRNSVRLQTVGLDSDSIYIVTRLVKVNGKILGEFLQINRGETSWIGKYSKVRSFWQINFEQVEEQQINIEEGRQNYISIQDLVNVSRQFIHLHKTSHYHKNWIQGRQMKLKYCFEVVAEYGLTHVMITCNFNGRACRNTVILIDEVELRMIGSSFKENKTGNYLEARFQRKGKYLVYVYAETMDGKAVPISVTLYSSHYFMEISEVEDNSVVEQRCFLKLMESDEGCARTSLQREVEVGVGEGEVGMREVGVVREVREVREVKVEGGVGMREVREVREVKVVGGVEIQRNRVEKQRNRVDIQRNRVNQVPHKIINETHLPYTYDPKTHSTTKTTNEIRIKNMHKELGMGFISINLTANTQYKLSIQMDHEILSRKGFIPMNTKSKKIQYKSPYRAILVFKLKGQFEIGQCFPGKQGLTISIAK